MNNQWPELSDFLRIYIADGPAAVGLKEELPRLNGHEAATRHFVREEPDEFSAAAPGSTLHIGFRRIANVLFESDPEFRAWLTYVLEVMEHERERVTKLMKVDVGSPGWIEAVTADYVRSYMIDAPLPGAVAWASSFPDAQVADEACAQAITRNEPRIEAWLESGRGRRLVVEARCDRTIGYGLFDPDVRWESQTVRVVRVVLVRPPEGELEIENAYPIPDAAGDGSTTSPGG